MRYLQAYTYTRGTGLYWMTSGNIQGMCVIVPNFAKNDYSYSMEVPWHTLTEYEVFENGTGI
jgi:hypothetical protein